MSTRWKFSLLFLLTATLACSLPTPAIQTPENLPTATETPFQPIQVTPLPELITATPAASSTPASPPPLSTEQLRNAEYISTGIDPSGATQAYQMQNGIYQQGTDPASPGYIAINLGETLAFGHLDNDELQDAAVILVENYGGTGRFVLVGAVLNRDGQPSHTASYFLGDRVRIDTLNIQNEEILLTGYVHGPQDGACCPSVPASINLRLLNEGQLMVTRFTTQAPNGQERAINIRAPLNGAEVSGSVTITGDVTIAPFENNLSYAVYDANYREIARSFIMVDAPDFGAPGTFALTIDLASLGQSGSVYIEISDLSAADGSVLALAQVQLNVK